MTATRTHPITETILMALDQISQTIDVMTTLEGGEGIEDSPPIAPGQYSPVQQRDPA